VKTVSVQDSSPAVSETIQRNTFTSFEPLQQ